MHLQELQKLETRLLEPISVPVIGRCLQKKAVAALAEDDSPDAVEVLAKAVISLKNEEIKGIVLDALCRLKNQQCIDTFCQVWADTRHQNLTNLLVKKDWVASVPMNIRVLSALKAKHLQVVTNGGREIVEPLLNAFQDRDSEIANRASECAISLTNPEAKESICCLIIEQDHQVARQVAFTARYVPKDPIQKALFYFMTEQWDKYESLDFDQTLLQKAHELANEQIRKRIAKNLRQAGRVEWLKVIAGGHQKKRLGAMTNAEWETTLAVLNSGKQWDEMWRLAQKAPAIWSKQLFKKMKQSAWLPKAEHEQVDFRKLKQLSDKCLDEIPPMAGLTDCQATLTGHADDININSVSFSLDGKILASKVFSLFSQTSVIRLWQMPNGKPLATLFDPTYSYRTIRFSPDGKILASCNGGSTVRLWQMPNGKPLATLSGHTNYAWKIKFSPDGQLLASSSKDGTIRLWQMPNGKPLATLSGHTHHVLQIRFSPDGKILASTGGDSIVRLWQMPNGNPLATLSGHTGWDSQIRFSPDSKILASTGGDSIVRLWQMPNGKPLATLSGHTHHVLQIRFSPDGKILASTGGDSIVRLWQMPNGDPLATLSDYIGWDAGKCFSPDSKILASGSKDGTIRLWQMPNGNPLATLSGHTDYIKSINFSPDGKILASGSKDGTIRLWQMPNGNPLATLTGHTDCVWGISFSPDGQILASSSKDKTIRLWSSKLPRLTHLPIEKLDQQDRVFIKQALQNNKGTEEERHWLEFTQALMDWHQRFDVEVENAPQLISTGEFDIEIEG